MFLSVAVIGEIMLGGYIATVDRVSGVQEHLRAHLIDSVHSYCMGKSTPNKFDHQHCWMPHKSAVVSCHVLNSDFFRHCNSSSFHQLINVYNKMDNNPMGQANVDFHFDNKNHNSRYRGCKTFPDRQSADISMFSKFFLEKQFKHLFWWLPAP